MLALLHGLQGGELILSPECLWGHAENWPDDDTDASVFAITPPLGLGGGLNCGCEVVKFQGVKGALSSAFPLPSHGRTHT